MNHPYEFNYIDPYPYRVPTEWNPVGAFRRVVHIPVAWEGKRVVLHLGAVKSAFYVWVNGQKVGYSQDSKMQAEFDITSYIQPGRENVIGHRSLSLFDRLLFRMPGFLAVGRHQKRCVAVCHLSGIPERFLRYRRFG